MCHLHICAEHDIFMPIHELSRQKRTWAEIVVWLEVNKSANEPPNLQFSSITVESFRALFRRLVVLADPSYIFPTEQIPNDAANWAVEFSTALDALSFPFQIDPGWLIKPSKVYVWPFLLCICEWLLKKGKARVGASVDEFRALSPYLVDAFPLEFTYGNGELHHSSLSFSEYDNLNLV